MSSAAPSYLISCNDHSNALLRCELEALSSSVQELASGLILAQPLGAASQPLVAAAHQGKLAFARHLFPVSFDATEGDAAIPELLAWCEKTAASTASSAEAPLSIQLRFVASDIAYTAQQLAADLDAAAIKSGATLRRKDPATVCSVVVVGQRVLAGVSSVSQNLSSWAGGAPRYRASPQQISRADSKLTEAIEAFGIPVVAGGRALDLGAAPGGWAQLLAERGMLVAAVDPAELDERLRSETKISHYQQNVDDFIAVYSGAYFDLVVNDMRMEALASASAMDEVAALLTPNAHGLMTVKLPELEEVPPARALSLITGVVSRLNAKFQVRGVRQLFHNRNEVTVWFTMRPGSIRAAGSRPRTP